MSTLDELFPDGKHRSDAPVTGDDRHTMRRLDEMFGDRRAELDRTHRASARPALVTMVDDAVADAKPLGTMPPAPSATRRRPRRRFDLINVAAGGLAVVALAVAASIGGIQAASASPATDALRVLTTDEKTIESATAGLVASSTRLSEAIESADAAAEALRPALEQVREATDPADIPEGWADAPEDAGTMPIADAAALDTVLKALDAYRTDLAAFELPELPAAYARASIDADSLTEVGAAIDAAQQQLSEIDRASGDVRTIRMAVDARTTAFAAQLAAFADTFPTIAKKVVDDHPAADQKLKGAVTASAAAIATADLLAEGASATLTEYRDAVVALVAEQVRVDRQREREREEQERIERERERQRQQQQPTDPGEGDPAQPEPTPTEPADQQESDAE